MEKQVHQLMICGLEREKAQKMVEVLFYIAQRSIYSFDSFIDLYATVIARGFMDWQTILQFRCLGIPISFGARKTIEIKDFDDAIIEYYENLQS